MYALYLKVDGRFQSRLESFWEDLGYLIPNGGYIIYSQGKIFSSVTSSSIVWWKNMASGKLIE